MNFGSTIRRQRGLTGKVVVLAMGFLLLAAGAAYAIPTDLFIQIDAIKGDSIDEGHEDWSKILSVNWGISMLGSRPGGGGGTGKAEFEDLTWNQVMDRSFPVLFKSTAEGRHIDKAFVDFTAFIGGKNQTYFQMEFRDVLLTSLQLSGKSGDDTTFNGSFAYNKILMTYTFFDAAGKRKGETHAEFDVLRNTGSAGELGLLYGMGLAGPTIVPGTPLPGTLGLLGGGLALLITYARRRR